MSYVADLHLHSRYARGVSPQLSLETLAQGARTKGIDLLATGDFTHPQWLKELHAKLRPEPDGLLSFDGVRFVLGAEISCVYQQGGRTHRVHLLLYAPDFDVVERLCAALRRWGNLASDARPTLTLSSHDLLTLALETDPGCIVVPAHAWTTWFSVYGSIGGFDSLADCFDDLLPYVTAIETGLSSDPAMNWRVLELDGMTIVSYSDAHSASRMGREATVFTGELSYEGYRRALRENAVAYTIEFHPEEGKYHYDGHRACGVIQTPQITVERGDCCPACGRRLTVGVAYRIERLAKRPDSSWMDEDGLIRNAGSSRPPFKRLVPLEEVTAEALGRGVATKGMQAVYRRAIEQLGPELPILESVPVVEIARVAGERVAEGVSRVRRGQLVIEPGYDGVYGRVHIWPEKKRKAEAQLR